MRLFSTRLLSTLALLSAPALAAQQPLPVTLISQPDASTKPIFSLVAAVRQLPGGSLLVNDIRTRQLTLLDPALASGTIVADSVNGGANAYGARPGAILGYFGDSTLFIDPADLSMFVISPTGAIARVAAVPRSQDASLMGTNLVGTPAIDAHGRLVYRGQGARLMPTPVAGGGFTMPDPPDSAVIVRVDLATRKLDTVATFKITKNKMSVTKSDKGGMLMTSEINPLQLVDEWAVLADGSVAVVRGQDYHIDWINADGTRTSTPKMAFDWQRLTDDDKVAVIDSAKTATERARAALQSGAAGSGASMPFGDGAAGTGQRITISMSSDPSKSGSAVPTLPTAEFVNASDLPDYRPPFAAGSVKADLDDNLWVRTSSARAGAVAGPIYDVINRQGVVVERVQIPAGRTIVGFGPKGIVYMQARDDKGAWLERTHR